MSVAAPIRLTPLQSNAAADTLQDLINRKREAEKNRYKFHLTETDCELICSNATELHFPNGQVIAEEGTAIKAMYRIKSGKVSLEKQGHKLFDLTQGYFIGEGLFIRTTDHHDIFGATLIANGPVTLSQVNLPFVKQLLEVDKVLAFKIYRHIAGKLSALLRTVVLSLVDDSIDPRTGFPIIPPPSTLLSSASSTSSTGSLTREHSDSLSSNDSNSSSGYAGSDSSSSSSGSGGASSRSSTGPDLKYPPKIAIMSQEMVTGTPERVARKAKKQCRLSGTFAAKPPLKVYTLEGNPCQTVTCKLTNAKIVIKTGSGFRSKKKIKYNEILDITKTGKNSATIIYNVQAKTLFFKTEDDMNEFCGVVQSLVSSSTFSSTNSSPSGSRTPKTFTASQQASNPDPIQPLHLSPSLNRATPVTEEAQHAADEVILHSMAIKQELKKGDIIVAEGDLYQRVYTVVEGEIEMRKKGRHLVSVKEGEVFGVLTLFHLRPCPLDIEVVSEKATLLVIPGYKFQELLTTNFPLAVRIHKKAAQLVYEQIERFLMSRPGVVDGATSKNLLL